MQGEWISKFSGLIKYLAQTIGIPLETNSLITKKSTVFIPQAMIYPSPADKSNVNNDQTNLVPFVFNEFGFIHGLELVHQWQHFIIGHDLVGCDQFMDDAEIP